MTRRRITATILAVVAAVVFGVSAVNASVSGSTGGPRSKLTIVAPAAPGGGWDSFSREGQQALRLNGIAANVRVVNVPGASGTIGLGQLVEMPGREDILMATGGVMVGGIILNNTQVTLADTVPIAKVAEDYNVLVVPSNSPYDDLESFLADFRERPGSMAIAGGSLGGIDHILAGLLAREAGIDPQDVNYIAYPGGGEVVTSLLSNTAVAGLSGFNEFRDQIDAGNFKALALSSPERLDGVDVPTLIESGYDVMMANWRGYVAPPGISDEVRQELIDMVTEMRDTAEWQETLVRSSWGDSFVSGDEFAAFIAEESRMTAAILKELGL